MLCGIKHCSCDACRRPQFNLLQKPSHLNTLPANYPSVFTSNPYQFNHFPSCAKDFSSKNSCLMNNRLEMDVRGINGEFFKTKNF